MMKKGWIPPRSPLSLLQEDLWSGNQESEWLILVSCILLNCTTRKQVEKVLSIFIKKWSTPDELLRAEKMDVLEVIAPLGFGRRRVVNLYKMSSVFISGFSDVRSLPGIGEYAARAHEIFCQGILGDDPPNDHALGGYWRWANESGSYRP